MEQAATPVTIRILEKRRERVPELFEYAVVNFAHYGVQQAVGAVRMQGHPFPEQAVPIRERRSRTP